MASHDSAQDSALRVMLLTLTFLRIAAAELLESLPSDQALELVDRDYPSSLLVP